MTRDEILGAVRALFSVLDPSRSLGAEAHEAELRLALDRLALASHYTDAPFDRTEHPDPAVEAYAAFRARVEPLFPGLGWYNEVGELDERVGETSLVVGDAIDDLVDIAIDLQTVALRWETTSEEDALWHFGFGFRRHWGAHLRSLQRYLHGRECWPS